MIDSPWESIYSRLLSVKYGYAGWIVTGEGVMTGPYISGSYGSGLVQKPTHHALYRLLVLVVDLPHPNLPE